MTFEELKEEARKLDCWVYPRKKYVRLHKCICGRSRIETRIGPKGEYRRCPNCQFQSRPSWNSTQAKRNWNEDVTKALNQSPSKDVKEIGEQFVRGFAKALKNEE